MPEPTGQHTHILQQEPGYEKGNGGQPCRTANASPAVF